jgi:hypothetical protein
MATRPTKPPTGNRGRKVRTSPSQPRAGALPNSPSGVPGVPWAGPNPSKGTRGHVRIGAGSHSAPERANRQKTGSKRTGGSGGKKG